MRRNPSDNVSGLLVFTVDLGRQGELFYIHGAQSFVKTYSLAETVCRYKISNKKVTARAIFNGIRQQVRLLVCGWPAMDSCLHQ